VSSWIAGRPTPPLAALTSAGAVIDADVDFLTGSAGNDWFVINSNDTADKKTGEDALSTV
jgi:hypothetical protein